MIADSKLIRVDRDGKHGIRNLIDRSELQAVQLAQLILAVKVHPSKDDYIPGMC